MSAVFYEDEKFIYDRVPIRVFNHSFYREIYDTIFHWHKNVEIDLITAGEIVYRIDRNEIYCRPQDILIINSGIPHSNYLVTRDERFEGITVQLALGFVQEWLGEKPWFILPGNKELQKELAGIVTEMGEAARNQEEDRDLHMMEEAFRLLKFLKRNCLTPPPQGKKQEEIIGVIKKVISYIDRNYQKVLTLKDVSKELGYSVEHLSRMFKEHVGINFLNYLQEVRLNHAVNLLREQKDISLTDCAMESGFPNSKSFITVFRRRFGMPPSEWKKKNVNN